VQNVPKIINSRRSPIKKQQQTAHHHKQSQSADGSSQNGAKFKQQNNNNHVVEEEEEEEAKPMVNAPAKFCGILQATSTRQYQVPGTSVVDPDP
jgi:hypothetical protein